MKTMKFLTLIGLLLVNFYGNSQIQFWSDNFEDAGAPSSGTRVSSITPFNCNPSAYYFNRTNGSDIPFVFSGFQGSKYWAAMDIDRGPACGANNTISAGQTITWSSINISGKSGLSFKGTFGANSGAIFQGLFFATAANNFVMDSMAVEYRIDGGAWTKIVGIYCDNPSNTGGTLGFDLNGDRIGDGGSFTLNNALAEITANIPGTGSLLDLRFDIFLNNSNPGSIAFDDFRLFETPSCTAPVITSNPPNRSICVNGNTTFTSSATGATAYQWQVNTGSGFTNITNGGVYSNATTSTLNITGATAGMNGYQYRCTAINGVASCFSNSSAGTLNISNIVSSTAKNDVLCFGNSTGSAAVSPSGGIGSYTYSWSPSGGTASIATGLAAGTYNVTITDAISCQITKTITINQPASALNASLGGGKTNVSCNGGSNGTATVSPTGGTPAYTYSWAPSGGTAATASGLAVGTYTVTVTDANNCQTTRSFTITQPTALNTTTGGKTDVSCNGGANGTATVSPTGGTPAYTYSWAPSGGTAATATGLAAGTYTVTVTDANGCQGTKSFTITQPTALNTSAGSKTDVSCNGGANGTATVLPTGGTPSYTYSWAPSGGTAATATGLSAGTYTVTVTDANACTATKSFTITQPTALNTSGGSKTDVSCNGGANGTATVSPTGGTPSYTYSWAPSGGTAATATGLSAGTYTVTVTDANACQGTKSFTINEPTLLNTSVGSSTDVSCHGGSNGTATVSATGGTPGYTYSWAPSGGTNATATGLAVGTYTVTVTDANGCQGTNSFIINEPTPLTISIGSSSDVSCNGGTDGTATVTSTGGTPGYTYSWSPIGGTAATATGLIAGTYTVTVTDANGCQETNSIVITEPAAITSSFSHTACVSYSWGTQTYSASGVYTQVFSDVNGCDSTVTLTLTINSTITNTVSVSSCNSYTWAQNNTTYTTSGLYLDTIASVGGCDSIVTLDLIINTPTSSTINQFSCGSFTWLQNGVNYTVSGTYADTISNMSGCDSIITLNLTIGGSTNSQTISACQSFFWPQTGIEYTNSGIYSDTLIDQNGCDSILVLNLTIIPVTVSATDNGDGTLSASTGVSYQWINCTTNAIVPGATNQTFAPTANGSYAVIVTNSSGCTDTSSCILIDDLNTNEQIAQQIQVYPNPTNGQIKIAMPFESALLTITDIHGKICFTSEIIAGQELNMESFEKGVYFLTLDTVSGKVLKRIVLN
jgi:hypothetical protein